MLVWGLFLVLAGLLEDFQFLHLIIFLKSNLLVVWSLVIALDAKNRSILLLGAKLSNFAHIAVTCKEKDQEDGKTILRRKQEHADVVDKLWIKIHNLFFVRLAEWHFELERRIVRLKVNVYIVLVQMMIVRSSKFAEDAEIMTNLDEPNWKELGHVIDAPNRCYKMI